MLAALSGGPLTHTDTWLPTYMFLLLLHLRMVKYDEIMPNLLQNFGNNISYLYDGYTIDPSNGLIELFDYSGIADLRCVHVCA